MQVRDVTSSSSNFHLNLPKDLMSYVSGDPGLPQLGRTPRLMTPVQVSSMDLRFRQQGHGRMPVSRRLRYNFFSTHEIFWQKLIRNQIVLGVSASGQSFHVDRHDATDSSGRLILNPPFDKSLQPLGNSDIPGDRSSKNSRCVPVPRGISQNFMQAILINVETPSGSKGHSISMR